MLFISKTNYYNIPELFKIWNEKVSTPRRSHDPVINLSLVLDGVCRVDRELTIRFRAENKRSQATAPAGIEKKICATTRRVLYFLCACSEFQNK
eukprot:UN06269